MLFITGNWVLGLARCGELAPLPWLESTRIRALRLRKEKQLRPKTPPSYDTFPALSEITREIEDEGFVHVGDAGWDWEIIANFSDCFTRRKIEHRPDLPDEQHDLSLLSADLNRARRTASLGRLELSLSYGLSSPRNSASIARRADQSFWQLYQATAIFSPKRCKRGHDRCNSTKSGFKWNGERSARPNFANIHKAFSNRPGRGCKIFWRGRFIFGASSWSIWCGL